MPEAISTIFPSDTRMSALTRPSGRTSVPPRTTVSIMRDVYMRDVELFEESESGIECLRNVLLTDIFGRMMADASLAAQEQQAGRHGRRNDHRIMSGAARHPVGRDPGPFDRVFEHHDDVRIHRDRGLIDALLPH